jgi:hypothetical protein
LRPGRTEIAGTYAQPSTQTYVIARARRHMHLGTRRRECRRRTHGRMPPKSCALSATSPPPTDRVTAARCAARPSRSAPTPAAFVARTGRRHMHLGRPARARGWSDGHAPILGCRCRLKICVLLCHLAAIADGSEEAYVVGGGGLLCDSDRTPSVTAVVLVDVQLAAAQHERGEVRTGTETGRPWSAATDSWCG